MKIIDNRGGLFGKINIIDFLVILFLFSLLPMFFFSWKAFKLRRAAYDEAFVEMEVYSCFMKMKPELTKIISVGDKESNEEGEVIGEIVSLGASMPYKHKYDIGKGQVLTKEDSILKQIDAKLKLKLRAEQERLYYKNYEIKIGSTFEFKTEKYRLTVTLFEEERGGEEKTLDLDVILKDVDKDTIKKIDVGDKELDENGNTIAEILSLGKIENSSTELDLGSGYPVLGKDSSKKQNYARIKLKCRVKK